MRGWKLFLSLCGSLAKWFKISATGPGSELNLPAIAAFRMST